MTDGPHLDTAIVNDEERLQQLLVVRWRDRLWIVPEWIDLPDQGLQKRRG